MPVVRVPTVLRKHTGGEAKIEAAGATVREVFGKLVAEHPGLEDSLFDGGELRGFINVYVDDEDIRYLDGLDTPVAEGAEVAIMPAVAGGATDDGGASGAGGSAPGGAGRVGGSARGGEAAGA